MVFINRHDLSQLELIGGLKFVEEPAVFRFFMGRLDAVSDWPEKLVAKSKADFGDSL